MKNTIIFENEKGYVAQTFSDTFEVYMSFTRDWDGIKEESLQYYKTFAPHYTRDWLGRTTSIYYKYDPKQSAIDCLL
jgi:hypothetical protein